MVPLGLGSSLSKASVVPAPPLLANDYSFDIAVSLRKLKNGVTNVVRVRKDDDDAERDFTAAQVAGGALAEWVAGSNNGFVRTLYDQSGNGNDLGTSDHDDQPKIVDSGSLVTVTGGRPAMLFATDLIPIALGQTFNINSLSSFYVFQASNTTQSSVPLSLGGSNNDKRWYQPIMDGSGNFDYGYAGGSQVRTEAANTNLNLVTMIASAGDDSVRVYRNGTEIDSGTSVSRVSNSNSTDTVGLGGLDHNEALPFVGKATELLVYAGDHHSNRATIEANITTHFSI
jgi:hypothetical protein